MNAPQPIAETTAKRIPAPVGVLAELTYRCPLACPYCSNPLEVELRAGELDTAGWQRVFSQAAELGILHAHLSGGEPAARRDLVEIVAHCSKVGLYTNLITSGVGLTRETLGRLADAGLDHVQLSIQDAEAASADKIGGYKGGFARKIDVAKWVHEVGLPLTINAVIHRANIERAGRMVAFAVELGARRVEIAHTQYYAWALVNQKALMPTRAQTEKAVAEVEALRDVYAGKIVIDHVIPDYYAKYPKACMGGWAKRTLNITPQGKALPCHAAETIPEPRILECERPFARRHLVEVAGLQCLPRHGMDARALPVLRTQRDRLRRLPLPGDGDDGRCPQRRSHLPSLARSCQSRSHCRRLRGQGRRYSGLCLSPL